MYFKKITLRNVGPIDAIDYEFKFTDEGNPKPLILVGKNGSGKSIFLSHLLNPLMIAQGHTFEDSDVESGKVYKFCSGGYIKTGKSFYYSGIDFTSIPSFHEWQLIYKKEDYLQAESDPDIHDSFKRIPKNESSFIGFDNSGQSNRKSIFLEEFQRNCILYFPPDRFENPRWLNSRDLKAEFTEALKISGISNRSIIQKSPLSASRNWLLDILLDMSTYEMMPVEAGQDYPTFKAVWGRARTTWGVVNYLLGLIFKDEGRVLLHIGDRNDRRFRVHKDNKVLVPDITQLSTGQTIILNILLSIIRDFDLSGAQFKTLKDVCGVVIIDEIDLHLHTDFQINLLPAIIEAFPKVQFVITTHSPLFLMGMKEQLGENGFDILSLPTGEKIGTEEYEEFQAVFNSYRDSDEFRKTIEAKIYESQKPVIFLEGKFDIKYLTHLAPALGREDMLDKIHLYDGDGKGNLDKIFKNYKGGKLAEALPRFVGLIYDCEVKTREDEFERECGMIKKRIIPACEDTPIQKGIENLIPKETINSLLESHTHFFNITKTEKSVRGSDSAIETTIEINEDEKGNFCDWFCNNGSPEDFAQFDVVFDLIEEVIEA